MSNRLWRRAAVAAAARLERPGPLWRAAMRAPAAVYAAVATARLERRAARAEHLPVPVVSVGALSVGGTGKTPAVRALATAFAARGLHPAIVGSGRAPDEERLLRAWLGDRARVGADRVRGRAAREAVAQGADVVLLDDGFQYRALERDFDVVCLDARDPLEGGRVLPAGRLREPPRGLERADTFWTVVPYDAREADVDEAARRVRGAALAQGVLAHRAERVVVVTEDPPVLPRGLDPGAPVSLCTGVARPARVLARAKAAGLDVRSFLPLPDHADLDEAAAERLWRATARAGARCVVVTEKDAQRPVIASMIAEGRAVVLAHGVAVRRGADVIAAMAAALAASGNASRRDD